MFSICVIQIETPFAAPTIETIKSLKCSVKSFSDVILSEALYHLVQGEAKNLNPSHI